MLPEESPAFRKLQAAHTTSQDGHSAEDVEEIRSPEPTADSPDETALLAAQDTPAKPRPQPESEAPTTPARDETIEAIFAQLDISQDGVLDKAEVGQMVALLRAQATAAAANEAWLQPTEEEVDSALREMDQ